MVALANVNQFGVYELREEELMMVDGGVWKKVAVATLCTIAIGTTPVAVVAAVCYAGSAGAAIGAVSAAVGAGLTLASLGE